MKHVSRILALAMALCMVLSLCAFADDFEPVEGTIEDDYDFAILGAEALEDGNDEPAIRVYYSFTNNSDEPESAWAACTTEATEAGYTLDTTYVWDEEDEAAEDDNSWLDIYPGVTILCSEIYSCNPDDDIITFTITSWFGEDEISCDFSYSDLPGRPDAIEFEAITDPVLTEDVDEEGDVGDEAYVAITGTEVVDDWDEGKEDVRVMFDYTNNSDEEDSFFIGVGSVAVFQDGVQLETSWADEETESDDLYAEDIEPGETVTCSMCFTLRSDDPVEIVLSDYSGNVCVGMFAEVD